MLAGFVFSLLLFSSNARAQASSQAKAAAEALFDEGLALMKSGDDDKACEKFEQSQSIEPGVGTLLYLGECYARTNRTASAWATFREAASLAEESGQDERSTLARRRAAELERNLAYLTVGVSSDVRKIPGLSVLRAGDEIALELLGVELPVDPGRTRIEAKAPGYEPFRSEIAVPAGGHRRIDVPPLVPVPVAGDETPANVGESPSENSQPASPAPAADTTTGDSGRAQRGVGLVIAGVGVVGVGIGSYFGYSAISKNSDAENGSCDEEVCQLQSDLDKVDEARVDATVSNIAFATGGAAILGGLLMYWLAPDASETGWTLQPAVSPHGFNLGLEGVL